MPFSLSDGGTSSLSAIAPSASFQSARVALQIQQKMVEERVKAEVPPTKKRKTDQRRVKPVSSTQLVDLTDSDVEEVAKPSGSSELIDITNIDVNAGVDRRSQSSRSAKIPVGWNRGVPIWQKRRDEAALRRYGTLNPSHQGSGRRNADLMPAALDPGIPVNAPDEPKLSAQQSEVLERIMRGESFFFTGSAGTGKSVLLRAIVRAFKAKKAAVGHMVKAGVVAWELGVTASTGMAAINIGGGTLHSWAGIGKGQEPVAVLTQKVIKYTDARQRWEKASALVIDEISMIDGRLFDKLEHIARVIRKSQKPFGGLQVILCGDFHQLPPVAKQGEPPAIYAFETAAWKKVFSNDNVVCLREVFRQKDAAFVRILEEMRKGRISPEDEAVITRLSRKVQYEDGIPPVELYPTKGEVDFLNLSKLAALPSEPHDFTATDMAGHQPGGARVSMDQAVQLLDNHSSFPKYITLKVGAIVMLLQNHTAFGLCNGSTGRIVDFMTNADAAKNGVQHLTNMSSSETTLYPVVEFVASKYATAPAPKRVMVGISDSEVNNPDGSIKAKRRGLPLILAWGLTVHKAQGQSLERVKVDLHRTFAPGQAYVGISRATSMDGLEVLHFDRHKLKVSNRVIEWSVQVEGDV